jgi:hypothetical protein
MGSYSKKRAMKGLGMPQPEAKNMRQAKVKDMITSGQAYPSYFPHWLPEHRLLAEYEETGVVFDYSLMMRCAAALRHVLEASEAVHLMNTTVPSNRNVCAPEESRRHYFRTKAEKPPPPNGTDWCKLRGVTGRPLQALIDYLYMHGFFAQGVMAKEFTDHEWKQIMRQDGGPRKSLQNGRRHRRYSSSHGYLEPYEVNDFIFITLTIYHRMFKVLGTWSSPGKTKTDALMSVGVCLAVGKAVFEQWFSAWGKKRYDLQPARMRGWYQTNFAPGTEDVQLGWKERDLEFYYSDTVWKRREYNDVIDIDDLTWGGWRQFLEIVVIDVKWRDGDNGTMALRLSEQVKYHWADLVKQHSETDGSVMFPINTESPFSIVEWKGCSEQITNVLQVLVCKEELPGDASSPEGTFDEHPMSAEEMKKLDELCLSLSDIYNPEVNLTMDAFLMAQP